MKKIFSLILVGLLVSGCSSLSVNSYKVKKQKEVVLSNGLRVLLIKDNSLPYFSVNTLVKVGSAYDPQTQSGLTSFVGEMLMKGSGKRSALDMADEIGQLGASIDVSTTQDFTFIQGSVLSFKKTEFLKLYSDVLLRPAFKGSEIRRTKKQLYSAIKKTVDRPSSFSRVHFNSYLYGSHPYGKRVVGSIRDIRRFKKKHLIKQYRKYFKPNNAVMAVVGQFDEKEVVKELENLLANWKPRNVKPLNLPQFPEIKGTNIKLVTKSDLKQTQVLIGHKGVERSHKDFFAIRIANTILGDGFTSRLTSEIRVKRGLTYSIYSYFSAKKQTGAFVLATSTRNDKAGQMVSVTLDVLKKYREKGVTAEEVKSAKSFLAGVFPQIVETPEALAQNILVLDAYGVDKDYLQNYYKELNSISASDVNNAIKKYFDDKNLKIFVYSKRNPALKELRELGTVDVKSYKSL